MVSNFNETLNELGDNFALDQARGVYAVAVPLMILCCAVSVILNILVLFTIRYLRSPLNPTLKLTFSLAGADLWSSSVMACGLVSHSYLPRAVHWPKSPWHDCASYALEALRLGGILSSVLHLFALACNHHFAIAYSIKYKTWANRYSHWISICIIILWIFPPSLYFFVFAAYFEQTFVPLTGECNSDFLGTLRFRIFVFLTIFLPLLAMTCVYVKIVVNLKRLVRSQRENGGKINVRRCARHDSFVRRKTSVIKTALLIVITSLMGWMPAILLFLLTCSICVYPYTALHSFPWLLFSLTISVNGLMILKGLLNPFVYAVRVPEIREAIVSRFHHPMGRRRLAGTVNCGSEGERSVRPGSRTRIGIPNFERRDRDDHHTVI